MKYQLKKLVSADEKDELQLEDMGTLETSVPVEFAERLVVGNSTYMVVDKTRILPTTDMEVEQHILHLSPVNLKKNQ